MKVESAQEVGMATGIFEIMEIFEIIAVFGSGLNE